MTTKIINLTQQSIDHKIEQFLEHNSDRSYASAVSNPDFRQKLITYVLRRVDSCYVIVEPEQESTLDERLSDSVPQCQQLDCLIQQGIDALLQPSVNWTRQCVPSASNTPRIEAEPSHWFG